MKISPSLFRPALPKQEKQEKAPEIVVDVVQQMKQSRQELKELAQQEVAKIQEARTDMGEDDPKAQRLIEKFKNGKKLTADEMAYVRKNAPGMVDYMDRIMREREIIELTMQSAPSKTEVQMVAFRAGKQIEKYYTGEEREIRARHLADAKHEYEKTDHYKEKPNTPLDEPNRQKRSSYKLSEKQQMQRAVHVYSDSRVEKKEPIITYET